MHRSTQSGMLLVALFAIAVGACNNNETTTDQAQMSSGMSFFVTSRGPGRGADLGGLAGADAHCRALAAAVGAGGKTWHAYVSVSAVTQPGQSEDPDHDIPAVNARDRIGRGPWRNAKGVVIATDVEQLHGDNNLNKETALNERGEVVNGRGDMPNRHDMLTGSQADGRAFPAEPDMTCGNWTRSGTDGAAMLGHHDRLGPPDNPTATSWNSSHASRGCSQEGLISTGGDGLFYCFAAD